ncbi:MAG: radical SAM protein [Bacillota bacterium]
MRFRHLFGPVPSRRLGVSLGIDLVPFKTCTLDCIYCECGKTTFLTVERKEYVPLKEVIEELNHYLQMKPQLDYITFSGSGEPTLHSKIEQVINYLKENYQEYKVCLLTNGTLFKEEQVRKQVLKADLIIPSLDTASEKGFQQINRPHPSLNCLEIIEGLVNLRREYSGEIRLEILIAPGFNDTTEELASLKEAIEKIKPDSIQLGTLDRPGTEEWLEPADSKKMEEIATYLNKAELIGNFTPGKKISAFDDSSNRQILQLLRRRPCTANDLCKSLNLRPAEIQKYINHLLAQDKIELERKERGIFYKVKK